MKNTIIAILFASIFVMISCGDDAADCTVQSYNSEVQSGIANINAAIQALNSDPTNSGLCDDFVDAANDFLDAMENFEGCDVIPQADYQVQLDQARQIVNDSSGC